MTTFSLFLDGYKMGTVADLRWWYGAKYLAMVGRLWHRRGKPQERGILGTGFGRSGIEQTASLSGKSSPAGEQSVTPTPNLEQGVHGAASPIVSSLAALSFSTATEHLGSFGSGAPQRAK